MEETFKKIWYLEGFTDESRRVWRTPLAELPFTIGRAGGCRLQLDSPSISQQHAKIFSRRDELCIVDLGSTNGTLINGQRIEGEQSLASGDVLRFVDWEFRLVESGNALIAARTTEVCTPLVASELDLERSFEAMVRSRSFWAVFQPIVRLADRSVVGYEALGRAQLGGVETPPAELFAIAEDLGRAAELSALFRREQLREATALPGEVELFLNTHPAELDSASALVELLVSVRHDRLPRLCVEINETAAMAPNHLSGLREKLAAMDANVAFDDFGVGQPRLLELAEMSPRYLKFDRAWIRGLDRASERRLELVRTLIGIMRGLEITPIAEGVERHEEAQACDALGFTLAQGFYFGSPDRAASFDLTR